MLYYLEVPWFVFLDFSLFKLAVSISFRLATYYRSCIYCNNLALVFRILKVLEANPDSLNIV